MERKINPRLYLDVHAIQTLPPANINRDDTGSPKTAQYGGVTRARVSSQSWKRAMRKHFNENINNEGVRTLRLAEGVAKEIMKEDSSKSYDECLELSKDMLEKYTIKKGNQTVKVFEQNKEYKIKALFFVSRNQLKRLAKLALSGDYDKNKIKEILTETPAIDIALFGRMVADDPSLNEDASSQVAHAISTHAIESEFDFFTAVDELAPEDNAGAGMLGTIEYNSSTLYRYANIALHDFYKQLGDKASTVTATKLFVEAFVKSMPTGKINTFANQTLPQAVVVSLRADRPVNMVSAFEKSIKSNEGYVNKSIERLFEEYTKYDKILDRPIYTAYLLLDDINVKDIGKAEGSINELLNDLEVEINKNL
ncbi:MAG: type I-E CRISPR-associated protein Cas7/Cse4/CasC [Ezakiella massiliensis]